MKRFAVLPFFVCLFALALVVCFLLVPNPPKYFRSASGPALNAAVYEETMDPQFKREPHASEGFENMKLITDGTGTRVEALAGPDGSLRDNGRYQYHSIGPGSKFEGEEGTIALDYFGIGYEKIPPERIDDYSIRVPAQYFDANLEPMSDEEILDRFPSEGDRELSFNGIFPSVKFGFRTDLQEEVKVMGYQLLDPALKRTLSHGYSWGGTGDRQYMEGELRRWHAGPLELVMDVAFGPVETYEFSAEAGTVQAHPEGQVKVIALLPDMRSHSSSRSGDRVWVNFAPVGENEKPRTVLVVASLPTALHMPLEFSFFDSDGKALRTQGSGTDDLFRRFELPVEPEEIHTIRMKHYPHLKRLVFQVPALPGLPPENDSLDNLFDARIPYVRVRYEHEMSRVLEGLTGMAISNSTGGLKATFPVSYESITAGELFDEYLAMHGGVLRPEVHIDPASGRIEIKERHSGKKWRFWLEKWRRRAGLP